MIVNKEINVNYNVRDLVDEEILSRVEGRERRVAFD